MSTETIVEPGLPEGSYTGDFVGVENKTYAFGERSLFSFQVDEGPEAGGVGIAFCGLKATTKTNRGKFLAWLAGLAKPERDMQVNPDDWIGRKYRFEVTTPDDADSPRVTRFILVEDPDADGDIPFNQM